MAANDRSAGRVASVMTEHRSFPPSKDFSSRSRIGSKEAYQALYDQAANDPNGFWAERAQSLPWMKPYDEVLRWNAPHAEWFVGGQTNASAACIDQHVDAGLGDKTAIVWVGEPTGERRTLSFSELKEEVSKAAAGLSRLGVKQGDVVSIYMPMTPELVIAMLACARIGAVHSVIFGGFSSEAIADRNNDAQAVAVITSDGGWRRGPFRTDGGGPEARRSLSTRGQTAAAARGGQCCVCESSIILTLTLTLIQIGHQNPGTGITRGRRTL